MALINSLLSIFLLFALGAPVLEKFGWHNASSLIYTVYGNFCHQFAFRSWFFFGRQAYYPAENAEGLLTYQKAFHLSADDLFAARDLIGNEEMGYKMAFCQRDFAMYAMLLFSGVIFALSGNRIDRISFWIWLSLGVLPLALDGITQLGGGTMGEILKLGARASTPLLRTITGGLFGLFSGWYLFPSIEDSYWVRKAKSTDS